MRHRPPAPRDIREAATFLVLALLLVNLGEPPLSLVAAGGATITAVFILARSIDKNGPTR